MADVQSFLIFQRYNDEFGRSERVVLDQRNPFEEYDDVKFRERFRLSKFAITKLLDEVFCRTCIIMERLTKNWFISLCINQNIVSVAMTTAKNA